MKLGEVNLDKIEGKLPENIKLFMSRYTSAITFSGNVLHGYINGYGQFMEWGAELKILAARCSNCGLYDFMRSDEGMFDCVHLYGGRHSWQRGYNTICSASGESLNAALENLSKEFEIVKIKISGYCRVEMEATQ